MKLIVAGVSGSGKSFIGEQLANKLELPFFDGDDFHPQSNVDKMAQGIPLNDDDRQGWLEDLNALLRKEEKIVLACSSLKLKYRDILRTQCPEVQLVYLQGDYETILARMNSREGHFFTGDAMLRSQFDALEEPTKDEAIVVSLAQTPEEIVSQVCAQLQP